MKDYLKVEEPISIIDIIEIKEFVKLKSPDDFYISGIKKIIEWDFGYIVLEKNKSLVVAYDSEGNFNGIVGQKGDGPEYYKDATDIAINFKTNSLLIYSRGDQAIFEYDDNRNFVRKTKIGIFASFLSLTETGNLAFYLDMKGDRDGEGNIFILDPKGKILEKRMKYPTDGNYFAFDYSGYLKSNNFYSYPLSSKIYKLDEEDSQDSLWAKINLQNGRSEDEIFNHTEFLEGDFKQKGSILRDFSIKENTNELIFTYDFNKGDKKVLGIGFFNQNKSLYTHENLKQSNSGDWVSKIFFTPGTIPSFSEFKADFITYSNMELLSKQNKQDIVTSSIDKDLKELIINSDANDNPIIIKFELKK